MDYLGLFCVHFDLYKQKHNFTPQKCEELSILNGAAIWTLTLSIKSLLP